ncbi:MAG: GntR family transcriptional regulator [Clostridiaceae bacterium]
MINIDSRSSTPIYQQIIDGMKENILKGILKPGDKLPSVRELSALITANPNTVSRAYMELERQNVIETLRGRGTYVSALYQPRMEEERMNALKDNLKKIIIEAHYLGLSKEDIINLMESSYYFDEGKENDEKR